MRRGIFLPFANTGRRHGASGALSVAAVKAQADGILIRCEGSQQLGQMGPPRRCGAPAAFATQRQEKRGRVFANARRDGLSQRHEMTRARLQPGCPEQCVHVYFCRANSDKLSNVSTCLIGLKKRESPVTTFSEVLLP